MDLNTLPLGGDQPLLASMSELSIKPATATFEALGRLAHHSKADVRSSRFEMNLKLAKSVSQRVRFGQVVVMKECAHGSYLLLGECLASLVFK